MMNANLIRLKFQQEDICLLHNKYDYNLWVLGDWKIVCKRQEIYLNISHIISILNKMYNLPFILLYTDKVDGKSLKPYLGTLSQRLK